MRNDSATFLRQTWPLARNEEVFTGADVHRDPFFSVFHLTKFRFVKLETPFFRPSFNFFCLY